VKSPAAAKAAAAAAVDVTPYAAAAAAVAASVGRLFCFLLNEKARFAFVQVLRESYLLRG
tara:strand:+ start:85 stop:264 length:180 start_codon:yes stop_codon:yes gene_type:complete